MTCPKCQAILGDGVALCPVCGHARSVGDSRREAIEPELLAPDSPDGRQQQDQQTKRRTDQEGGRPRPGHADWTEWSQTGGQTGAPYGLRFHSFHHSFSGGGLPVSCLPSLISLALTLSAAMAYGLLAAIGFAIFTAIGRGLTFSLTVKRMMEGRPVNPWALHIATWALCWFLVAWLSGNLQR